MHGILHSVAGGEDPELASGNIHSSNIEGKIAECATDGRVHMIGADLLTVMRTLVLLACLKRFLHLFCGHVPIRAPSICRFVRHIRM